MAKTADWLSIKNEYINTNISYRKLAEKYDVSFNTLKDHATKDRWKSCHDTQHHNTTTKIQQRTAAVIVKKEVDRMTKIISLADKLGEKLESSIEQLDTYIVRNKKKTKTIQYNDLTAVGKPTKEVIDENETIEVMPGNIDRQGLKLLTAALKDIKDIQSSSTDNSDNQGIVDFLSALSPKESELKELFADEDNNEQETK